MKTCRAFCCCAVKEGHIDTVTKVLVSRLLQQLVPILSEGELATIFICKQLDSRIEIGKRNHALIAFVLDNWVRLSEIPSLTTADAVIA